MQEPNTPSLHTPEELLAGAQYLLTASDEQLMRAAVLEALAALEWYIHETIFPLLNQKLGKPFTDWLETKTKMNFEDRLTQLVPLATGIKISRSSPLWAEFQASKKIRNRVAHSGQKITRAEARNVLKMVKDWLAFLGSTAEVDLSLLGLKKYLENNVTLKNELEAIRLVQRYYEKTSPSVGVEQEKLLGEHIADIVLSYDNYNTLIEVKFSQLSNITKSVEQARSIAAVANTIPGRNAYRPVVVFFTEDPITDEYKTIKKSEHGVSLIVIRARKSKR